MTRYVTLSQFLIVAERVTGIEANVLAKMSRTALADSALQSPAAGFGDDDFYPDMTDKAAVLCCHLAWNHALPDGNKRSAWETMRLFIHLNGGLWGVPVGVDEAVDAMVAIASHDLDEDGVADWLRERITWP